MVAQRHDAAPFFRRGAPGEHCIHFIYSEISKRGSHKFNNSSSPGRRRIVEAISQRKPCLHGRAPQLSRIDAAFRRFMLSGSTSR